MKRLFCILFCLSLLSCGTKEDKTPENLLPQDKMVQILADIHIAEAQIETKVVYPDTALMTFNDQEKKIFEKHQVSEQEFRDTYNYYKEHLKEMDKLYEIIVDTLSLRETKMREQGNDLEELEGTEE